MWPSFVIISVISVGVTACVNMTLSVYMLPFAYFLWIICGWRDWYCGADWHICRAWKKLIEADWIMVENWRTWWKKSSIQYCLSFGEKSCRRLFFSIGKISMFIWTSWFFCSFSVIKITRYLTTRNLTMSSTKPFNSFQRENRGLFITVKLSGIV